MDSVCMQTMLPVPSACVAGSMKPPLAKMASARVVQRFWECNVIFSGAYTLVSTADFFVSNGVWNDLSLFIGFICRSVGGH